MDQLASNEIIETIQDLKNAKANLERIYEEFSEEAELCQIYSYAGKELVRNLEKHLEYLLIKQTDSEFTLTSSVDDVDVWVHIKGEKYNEGRGPIKSIGSYLKKFNTAGQHTLNILRDRLGNLEGTKFDSYFELAEIGKGSLKLGLRSKVEEFRSEKQDSLFAEDADHKLSQVKMYSELQKLTADSLILLLKTLSSADDDQAISEIFDEFGEEDAVKLFHFAKELAPSPQSNINQISYEGRLLPENIPLITTDSSTRKKLISRSKDMIHNKEFIQGTALIEQYKNNVNDNYYSLFARPLKYDKKIINIELRIEKKQHNIIEEEVLGEFLDIEGFLHFNNKSNPTYVVVDGFTVDKEDDMDFGEDMKKS